MCLTQYVNADNAGLDGVPFPILGLLLMKSWQTSEAILVF